MRLGWQLLLPLAVLNVIISATVVALGLPWWVNGIIGLAIIAAVLLLVRRRTHEEQVPVSTQGKPFPSSVRLAKFEPVAATEALSAAQDVTT
jgi:NADH-quinone oxidoreductase subunit H